jgi:hypothetical protein
MAAASGNANFAENASPSNARIVHSTPPARTQAAVKVKDAMTVFRKRPPPRVAKNALAPQLDVVSTIPVRRPRITLATHIHWLTHIPPSAVNAVTTIKALRLPCSRP